ncbi:hypothetical protein G7046_g6178 [Stylonectria norvegica]|nr:hypothetical protein G7046_g6178 [Stylonectria norvegica]
MLGIAEYGVRTGRGLSPPLNLMNTLTSTTDSNTTVPDTTAGSPGRFHLDTSAKDARTKGHTAARQLVGITDVSDDLQTHLLGLFWCWQNSWHRFVPEQAFLRDFDSDRSSRFCSPLLLLAIFSVASRYSDRPEVRLDVQDSDTAGEMFAAQAKVTLHYEFESPTTMTVQAAALLSIREMALDMESSAWVYCGLATRMACNPGVAPGLLECPYRWRHYCRRSGSAFYNLDVQRRLGMTRDNAISQYYSSEALDQKRG